MTEPKHTAAAPPTDMWEDDAWDDLLSAIGEQMVVPIIGPDLILVGTDGAREPLEHVVARTLGERLPWPQGFS
ncbi:MAG: hypothetical protein ACRENC_17950, partial [Gemmatimonadaceae bacterium]